MSEKSSDIPEYILIIHDIRSVYNVGALFRTADAIGITRIILSGYSPTPLDRFGRQRSDLAKSALGAEQTMKWEYSEDIFSTIKRLKQESFNVIGLEQDTRSVDYKRIDQAKKMAFIIGTETTGMTLELKEICDVLVEIPMLGSKESLNVSVATGILLYRILDK